jgi:Sulfotransferase family
VTHPARWTARQTWVSFDEVVTVEVRPERTRRAQPPAATQLLAFVDIPETAGERVISLLAAAYPSGVESAGNYLRNPARAASKASRPRLARARVAVGQVPYGLFRGGLPPQTRYMTFLREPVDRVLSHYYGHIHHPGSSQARRRSKAKVRAGSLEEAMVKMRLPQLNNLATRFLCDNPAREGELPRSALNEAKINLRAFAFVGIHERFEDSASRLQAMLGVELPRGADAGLDAGAEDPGIPDASAEDRALALERNRMDQELYAFGLQLFEGRPGQALR